MKSRRSSIPTAASGLRAMPYLSAFLFLVIATSPALFAQVDRAALTGTVTDPSGAILGGATVKVRAVDTGIEAEQITNPKGYYLFPGLAVGHYTVIVTHAGFKTRVVDGVVLLVGQTRTLDVAAGGGRDQRANRSQSVQCSRESQFG